jgi:hypothetical protein
MKAMLTFESPAAWALSEEFRPFGPTYFWAKAAKSKQKPLFKRL